MPPFRLCPTLLHTARPTIPTHAATMQPATPPAWCTFTYRLRLSSTRVGSGRRYIPPRQDRPADPILGTGSPTRSDRRGRAQRRVTLAGRSNRCPCPVRRWRTCTGSAGEGSERASRSGPGEPTNKESARFRRPLRPDRLADNPHSSGRSRMRLLGHQSTGRRPGNDGPAETCPSRPCSGRTTAASAAPTATKPTFGIVGAHARAERTPACLRSLRGILLSATTTSHRLCRPGTRSTFLPARIGRVAVVGGCRIALIPRSIGARGGGDGGALSV